MLIWKKTKQNKTKQNKKNKNKVTLIVRAFNPPLFFNK